MKFHEAVKLMKKGIECRPGHWEKGITQTIKDVDDVDLEIFSIKDPKKYL